MKWFTVVQFKQLQGWGHNYEFSLKSKRSESPNSGQDFFSVVNKKYLKTNKQNHAVVNMEFYYMA